jgi:hypothetical protein
MTNIVVNPPQSAAKFPTFGYQIERQTAGSTIARLMKEFPI